MIINIFEISNPNMPKKFIQLKNDVDNTTTTTTTTTKNNNNNNNHNHNHNNNHHSMLATINIFCVLIKFK